ncbi:MAG TPA: hypothetical protein VFB72_19245 [Verrucomicrobiae bacterium]|nr:hypothetical protein [Verrucomicrobiae bacterium]
MFGIIAVAFVFASAVFSAIYMFEHRGVKRRVLPAVSIIAFFLIGLVPESGGTNSMAHWHQAAVLLAWSVWALGLSFFFFKGDKSSRGWFLRVAFGVMGLFGLFGGVSGLVESWGLLHSF